MCDFNLLSKKPLPNPNSQRFTPRFSSKGCITLSLPLNHLISFELIFVYVARYESSFILSYVDIWLLKYHLLNRLFFPYYLGNFVENQLSMTAEVYLWILNSIPLIHISILILGATLISIIVAWYKFRNWEMEFSSSVLSPCLFTI